MAEVIFWGRWRLRNGQQEAALVGLMRHVMIPHYAKYDTRIKLGLLHISDSRVYLTTQRWPNRELWEDFPNSPFYEAWMAAYEPILEQWDQLMELEEEWECEELL